MDVDSLASLRAMDSLACASHRDVDILASHRAEGNLKDVDEARKALPA